MRTPSPHRSPRASRRPASTLHVRLLPAIGACLLAFGLCTPSLAATGPMDFLYISGHPPASEVRGPQQRVWKIGEFSAVRLVPAEGGAAPSQLPVNLQTERLRAMLASAELQFGADKSEPLFGRDELDDLVPGLAKALAAAGPGDDLLVLSTARRSGNFLLTPLSITARMFVSEGRLQLIVREARRDAYSEYRMARIVPEFKFGSRTEAATRLQLRSSDPSAAVPRADWLSWPLAAAAAAPAAAYVVPPAVAPVPAPAAAPQPAPRTDAAYDEAAQRLRGLQKLRDAGLISEEEFQRKRREILDRL